MCVSHLGPSSTLRIDDFYDSLQSCVACVPLNYEGCDFSRETCYTESWRRSTGRCSWSGSTSTLTIWQMVEAAEIITFDSETEPGHLAHVDHALLRRQDRSVTSEELLEVGINVVVARRTRDLGVDTGGGSRRAVGVMRKRLCKAAKRSRWLTPKKRPVSTAPTSGYAPALVLRDWALCHPPCKASDRALWMRSVRSLVDVSRGAVRDDSFHLICSCLVINAIPHDDIRKS